VYCQRKNTSQSVVLFPPTILSSTWWWPTQQWLKHVVEAFNNTGNIVVLQLPYSCTVIAISIHLCFDTGLVSLLFSRLFLNNLYVRFPLNVIRYFHLLAMLIVKFKCKCNKLQRALLDILCCGIKNILDWCCHLYSSCGSAKHW
jgi:hypothetical protein